MTETKICQMMRSRCVSIITIALYFFVSARRFSSLNAPNLAWQLHLRCTSVDSDCIPGFAGVVLRVYSTFLSCWCIITFVRKARCD